jgi:uridylate kinase
MKFYSEMFKRIIVKISGEFLAGKHGSVFDIDILDKLSNDLIDASNEGHEIGVILGGGNIYRGKQHVEIDQNAADNVGMLATIQNAIIVSEILRQKNQRTEIFSAFQVDKIVKYYTYQEADIALKEGNICFFAGGTGNPYFTTDTAMVLRAVEMKCDLALKGTKVDGVYTDDPMINKDAIFIEDVTYTEALARNLNIMDMTAFSLARDYKIPIKVFNITVPGNLIKALSSKEIGTLVYE